MLRRHSIGVGRKLNGGGAIRIEPVLTILKMEEFLKFGSFKRVYVKIQVGHESIFQPEFSGKRDKTILTLPVTSHDLSNFGKTLIFLEFQAVRTNSRKQKKVSASPKGEQKLYFCLNDSKLSELAGCFTPFDLEQLP